MTKGVYSTPQERAQKADPKAVETAERLSEAIPNDAVILFGSRARGNHRPDSDIDLLVLGGHSRDQYTVERLCGTGALAAAKAYGGEAPEAQVIPMPTGRYRREKHSLNFLCARAAREGIIVAENPEQFLPEPGNQDCEPLYAREQALEALAATTWLGEIKMEYPYDLAWAGTKVVSAGLHAHEALASSWGVNLKYGEGVEEIQERIWNAGGPFVISMITNEEWDWYRHEDQGTHPWCLDHPKATQEVRDAVEDILRQAPTRELLRTARRQWKAWKRSRNRKPRG